MPDHDILIQQYTTFLKQVLTPNRLQHSMGVMQVMGELADIYKFDREKALSAGLLHDAAKDLKPEQYEAIVHEARIEFQYPCEREYNLYLHGPVGAYFVQKELGVTDLQILEAIALHTWCDGGMYTFSNFAGSKSACKMEGYDPFDWCLRFADLLEPNRKWDGKAHLIGEGLPRLRKQVYAGNLKQGAFIQTEILIGFFEENEMPVHPNYYRIFQELSAHFDLDENRMK